MHRASDLLSQDGEELLAWLEGLRDRGLVERIGVSIYEESELEKLPLNRLQMVQLTIRIRPTPNQQWHVDRLHELGIAVREVCYSKVTSPRPQQWLFFTCLSKASLSMA